MNEKDEMIEKISKIFMNIEGIDKFVEEMCENIDKNKIGKNQVMLKSAAIISTKVNYDQACFLNAFMLSCRKIESVYLEKLNMRLEKIYSPDLLKNE